MYVCMYVQYVPAEFFVRYSQNNEFKVRFTGPRHIRQASTTVPVRSTTHASHIAPVMSTGAQRLLETRCGVIIACLRTVG